MADTSKFVEQLRPARGEQVECIVDMPFQRPASRPANRSLRLLRREAKTQRHDNQALLNGRPLEPTIDFMRLLWSIEHGLQSASKRMETTLGVTGPQRLVLKIVTQFPGISARDLAHIVHLHPSTITGILQRLVRKGLLVREPDRDDRRRVHLRVRPQAKQYTDKLKGTIESAVERALSGVPRRHVRDAREVLAAIVTALETNPD